jgi:hypothetical protein
MAPSSNSSIRSASLLSFARGLISEFLRKTLVLFGLVFPGFVILHCLGIGVGGL